LQGEILKDRASACLPGSGASVTHRFEEVSGDLAHRVAQCRPKYADRNHRADAGGEIAISVVIVDHIHVLF